GSNACRISSRRCGSTSWLAASTAAAAQAALARLRTFDWYTTRENLTVALPALAARMGTPAPTELHAHRTDTLGPDEPRMTVLRTVPMVADLRYCIQINQTDLQLYRLVSEAAPSPELLRCGSRILQKVSASC